MEYCIFENTYRDLLKCHRILEQRGIESLSEEEKEFAELLILRCDNISKEFGDDLNEL
jgi:hypothetical protein